MFNHHYKQWLAANGGPVEGRRALAEYAEAHGTRAGMRLSGASKVTVNRLRRQERAARAAGAGGGGFRGTGRPPLSDDDEERIVDAKREHPEYGPKRLKSLSGVPYSESRIWAVLKKKGLTKPGHPARYHDPAFMAVHWERWIGYAKMWIEVEEIATAYALKLLARGKISPVKPQLERAHRKLEEARRKTAFWKRRAAAATTKQPRMNADER